MINLNMLNILGISNITIILLVSLALLISCLFSNIMRYVTVVVLTAVLSITGVFSTFYSYKYFTTKGAVYGKYEMGANNITKVLFDGSKTFTYSLLGFAPTSQNNIYECKVTFDSVTLDLSKFNNMSLNNSACNLQKQDTNAMQVTYSYAFLDENYNSLCSDTLSISLYTYTNSMQLTLSTQSGDSGAKYWRKFMQKNGLTISLTTAESKPTEPEKDPEELEKVYTGWQATEFKGLTNFSANSPAYNYIWTDGIYTYYSNTTKQYILDTSTQTWFEMTWGGSLSTKNFIGGFVWTDGDNYYFSYGTEQYVLDVAQHNWTAVEWQGLTKFYGNHIWTDGNNYYYLYDKEQYVLSKGSRTWTKAVLSGDIEKDLSNNIATLSGRNVWTDGLNYYVSYSNSNYYIIDTKTLKTTKITLDDYPKDIDGKNIFSPLNLWTDGINLYYSYKTYHYVMNTSTHCWEQKIWTGVNSFYGEYVWSDGTNIYYSNGSYQYVLV